MSDCPRCGQATVEREARVCEACRTADREPQGEEVRLFAPAPVPPPGQMSLG